MQTKNNQLLITSNAYCGGTKGLRHQNTDQTNRPRATNEYFIARFDVRLSASMHRHGKRLHQARFLHGHMVGQLEAKVGRVLEEARQRAIGGRSGQKVRVGTEVVVSRLAGIADAAGNLWFHRDTVTRLEVLNAWTDLSDDRARFVAEDYWSRKHEGADFAFRKEVDIGTADSHRVGLQYYLFSSRKVEFVS